MEIINLGEADGLPPVDWAPIAEKLDANSAPDREAHNARTKWLTTVNEDGSPHVTAVGAVRLDGAFWFQTGTGTRKCSYLPTKRTDTEGNCTFDSYDTAGNLTQANTGQTSASCTNTGGTVTSATYQGDGATSCGGKAGQVCSTTDGRGKTTSYVYDAAGNLTSITPPAPLGSTSVTPDAIGRPSVVTDGAGHVRPP
jgi:YD repeat-containing protein